MEDFQAPLSALHRDFVPKDTTVDHILDFAYHGKELPEECRFIDRELKRKMQLPWPPKMDTVWEFNGLVKPGNPGQSEWRRYVAMLGVMEAPHETLLMIRWGWRQRLARRAYQVQAAAMNLWAKVTRQPWPEG